MRSIDAEKNMAVRRAILDLLKTEYPAALDLKVLMFSLDNLGYPMPEEALQAHLRYLQEKGLTSCRTKRGYGFRFTYACLTAKGWDFLDGNIEEEGIG